MAIAMPWRLRSMSSLLDRTLSSNPAWFVCSVLMEELVFEIAVALVLIPVVFAVIFAVFVETPEVLAVIRVS